MTKNQKKLRRQHGDAPSHPLFQAWREAHERGDAASASSHMHDYLAMARAGKLSRSASVEVLHKDSTLRKVCDTFANHSLIPVELPLWACVTMTCQYMAQKGCTLELGGGKVNSVRMLQWSLLCAPSGGGKTFVTALVRKALDSFMKAPGEGISTLDTPKSAEGFLAQLMEREAAADNKDHHPSVLVWDEFGDAMGRAAGQGSSNEALRSYLLQAYQGGTIRERLKAEVYEVRSAQINLLALTQTALIGEHFLPRDWQSGLLQRMTMVVCSTPAHPDDPRELGRRLEVATVATELEKNGQLKAWAEGLLSATMHPQYTITAFAREFCQRRAGELMQTLRVDTSYALRAMYTAYRLAVVMHVLHGHTESVIDIEDCHYAWRLVELTLHDLGYLMEEGERSDVGRIYEAAEASYLRLRDTGRVGEWTHRHLVRNCNALKNVDANLVKFAFQAVSEAASLGHLRHATVGGFVGGKNTVQMTAVVPFPKSVGDVGGSVDETSISAMSFGLGEALSRRAAEHAASQ